MRTDKYYILKDLGVSSEVLYNLDEDEAYNSQIRECYDDMFRCSMRNYRTGKESSGSCLAA